MTDDRSRVAELKRQIYLIVLPLAGVTALIVGLSGSLDATRSAPNWRVPVIVGVVVFVAWSLVALFPRMIERIERYLIAVVGAAFAVAMVTAALMVVVDGGDQVDSLMRVGMWITVIAGFAHVALRHGTAAMVSWGFWSAFAVGVAIATAFVSEAEGAHVSTLIEVTLVQACAIVMIQGIVHVTRSERHRAGAFASMATTDALTDLPNRRGAEDLLEREVARAIRYERELSLVWLDLDRFKAVNDRYGHEVGDRVLVGVASALRADLREQDVLARWGGEEFVAILPEQSAESAMRTAERMRARLEATDVGVPSGAPVTASFGVAPLVAGESAAELLRRADRAMYDAKHAGKNLVRRADASGDVTPQQPA